MRLDHPPTFRPPDDFARDRVYRFLERTWMLQQLPWVVPLGLLGGLSWIVWGIAVRVSVCVTGHWLIGYFAHNAGHRTWNVDGAAVQGYNVPLCGLITMGESYHNNHHAFPGSARLGLLPWQLDPGWWVLCALARFRLVWDMKEAQDLPPRRELRILRSRRVRPDSDPFVRRRQPPGTVA